MLLLNILLLDLLDECHLLLIQVSLLRRQSRSSLLQLSSLVFESPLALLNLLLLRTQLSHLLLHAIELAPLFKLSFEQFRLQRLRRFLWRATAKYFHLDSALERPRIWTQIL